MTSSQQYSETGGHRYPDGPTYRPIESYALIGNMETCALVGTDGSIDWYPIPHLESPSVFAAILDIDRGGRYRVAPTESATGKQNYVPRTNVLQTEFRTDRGSVRVTDFMPPTEADIDSTTRALIRKVECTTGSVDVSFEFDPRPEYARTEPELGVGDNTIRVPGSIQLALGGTVSFGSASSDAPVTVTRELDVDETHWLALVHGDHPLPDADECAQSLDRTIDYWQEWAHHHEHTDAADCVFGGPWHDLVVRSGLVLKLLTHIETGAVAAAPTTSLPEEIGGERNWDYRYSWPRDAAFTVQALAHLGHLEEAGAYFEWFADVCNQPPEVIQPLYGLHGEIDLQEEELEYLRGYRDSQPVRIGNAAVNQRQLDVYGELVLAMAAAVHHGWELREDNWPAYRRLVDYVTRVWEEPDSGIWEVRSEPRHFVHSKLMCWAALDRGIDMATQFAWDAPLDRWRTERQRIREAILTRGFDADQHTFTQAFDSDALDATALLIPIVGFLPFDDERVTGTIEAIRTHLETDDGLLKRYNGEDGLPGDEGTFTLCSFWLVDVLALSGHLEEARDRFQTLIDYASPLGLLAEEIDPKGGTGTHLGNFPQAFSHVGIVNSALYIGRLSEPDTPGPEPIGIWLGEGPAIPD